MLVMISPSFYLFGMSIFVKLVSKQLRKKETEHLFLEKERLLFIFIKGSYASQRIKCCMAL